MTVFLSYARLDNIVVDPVVAGLDRHDVRYWFDRRDIPVSFPWKTEIGHAIRSSVLVVILESDAWHASTHCRSELAVAVTLDKPVIHIDVRDTGPDEIVAIIERALSALTPIQRAHTDLLARSGSWHRNERAESGLVGGRLLQQLQRVVADDPPLPSEARDFLASSELRDARRRRLRKVGVVVTLAAFGVIWLIQAVDQRGEEKLRGQATILAMPAHAHYQTEGNPYAGLRSAADESRGGDDSYLARFALVGALDVPVPEESTLVPGNPLAGFAEKAPGVLAVRDKAGAVLDLSAVPAPERSGATSVPAPRPGPFTVRAVYGDLSATGKADGSVLVRSSARPAVSIVPDVDHGAVTALDVSIEASAVAVVHDGSGSVSFYDLATGALMRRIPVGTTVRAVAVSPDGRTIAAGVGEKVVLADVATGRHRVDLRGPTGQVGDVRWSDDGTSVWAINGEHRVSRWRWRDERRLADDRTAWFVGLSAPGTDGSLLAVTRSGDVHRVSDARDEILVRTGLTVVSASVDATNERVLLGTADGRLHVLDVRTGIHRVADDRPGCTPLSTTWVPNTDLAMVACLEGPLRRIDTSGASPNRNVDVPFGASAVTASTDGAVFVGAADGQVYRTTVDATDLEVIGSDLTPTEWRTITLAADGRTLLLTGTGTGHVGHLYVGHINGREWAWYTVSLPQEDGEQSQAAAFSPDGSIAAIGTASGTVHFLATKSGDLGLTRTAVAGAVTGLQFTGAGLVASSRDGVVERIDPCTGCESTSTLVELADRRLAEGRRLGLVE